MITLRITKINENELYTDYINHEVYKILHLTLVEKFKFSIIPNRF